LYGTIDPAFKTLYTIFLKDAKAQKYNGPISKWKPSKTALGKIQQKHRKYLYFGKRVSIVQRVSMNGVQFWANSYQKVTYCIARMSCICPVYVLYMSCICPVYVLYISCICPVYVLYMSCICPVYVLYMSCQCICPLYVLYMSSIHVLYMSSIYVCVICMKRVR
jgi:hypothetical protein